MPKTTPCRLKPHEQYWEKRLRSKAFNRDLGVLLMQELKSLSRALVKDVLDPALVRTIIEEWDPTMINREMVADLIIRGQRQVTGTLRRKSKSIAGLLDRSLIADIDAILAEDLELSPRAEEFVAGIMRQEFVRRLFTDIIFTSIVSFYQKVNPLFGGITVRILEEQIKGFIRLFMPMIERQATAFAVSERNQRILLDFSRSIIRQLLEAPFPHYAAARPSARTKRVEALIRKAVGNPKLGSLVRQVALVVWGDLYETIQNQRVGDLVRLEEHARWLAERGVELILPALRRPQILRFVAAEAALAQQR